MYGSNLQGIINELIESMLGTGSHENFMSIEEADVREKAEAEDLAAHLEGNEE